MNNLKLGWFFVFIFVSASISDYFFHSKIEGADRTIPQIIRGLFFVIMLFFVVSKSMKTSTLRNNFTTAVNLVTFIIVFFSIFNLEYVVDNFISYLKVIYGIISFYFFYLTFKLNIINKSQITFILFSLTLIYFFSILRDSQNTNLFLGSKNFYVSNYSYQLLKLFPLAVLLKSKFKNLIFILIGAGIIISLKRGPLLAFSLCVAIYYINLLFNKRYSLYNRTFLLSAFLFVIYNVFQKYHEAIIIRSDDFNSLDTFGSGRINLYKIITDEMLQSDFIVFMFGNGFFSSINLFSKTIGHEITAHSDFFEMFYNYGVIGLSIIVLFYVIIFKQITMSAGLIRQSLIYWFIINISTSIYSINFYSAEMIYSYLSLAYIAYLNSKNFNNKIDENFNWR